MRRHPEIGAELLRNIPYLEAAIPIVRHHHERWDGSGYPDHLANKHIPAGARIVSVADSLDAMTTSRSYQQAASLERAYNEITKNSGKQYDPEVVDAFKSAWGRIEGLLLF